MLERAAKIFPNVELVSVRAGRITTSIELFGNAAAREAVVCGTVERGIRNGDRVATLMWNQQEHVEAYFGVPAVGAVLHTLNLRLHPEEIAYIVNHAEDRFLIVDATLLDVYEQFRPHVQLERVFVVDHGRGRQTAGGESYEGFLAAGGG